MNLARSFKAGPGKRAKSSASRQRRLNGRYGDRLHTASQEEARY